MVTYARLDPSDDFLKAAMGFLLAQSDLTLDDLEGSKIKIILYDVKYVKNSQSYNVGPNRYYNSPWASLWMTLRG